MNASVLTLDAAFDADIEEGNVLVEIGGSQIKVNSLDVIDSTQNSRLVVRTNRLLHKTFN